MDFLRSLKGKHPNETCDSTSSRNPNEREAHKTRETYSPPSGPPPSYRGLNNPFRANRDVQPGQAPLAGPALSSHAPQEDLANTEFAPPPGPPPSKRQDDEEPPPYHDWTSVPDTSLLPPPPSIDHKTSPTGNADTSEADRAHEWCKSYSLIKPHEPTNEQYRAIRDVSFTLVKPREYNGSLQRTPLGQWKGSTSASSKDSCLLTSLPLYFATVDSPTKTRISKTIYFEVHILSFGRSRGDDASSMALGFCAIPYPSWRMPGWERGSLAVHADDGRRYVNDTYGGKDFVSPIKAGETVGIGITFTAPDTPSSHQYLSSESVSLNGEVFFTRGGRKEGTWNLHEELDADNEFGVLGLDGGYDLYGAIGSFGEVKFEARFNRRDWLWRPN